MVKDFLNIRQWKDIWKPMRLSYYLKAKLHFMKKTKVLAMLTAVVLLIGMFCICAAAETKEATGCGQQLSLGDDLDMKFYVAADADTTVNVTVDGKTTAYDLRGKAPVAAKRTYSVTPLTIDEAKMVKPIVRKEAYDNSEEAFHARVQALFEKIYGVEFPAK